MIFDMVEIEINSECNRSCSYCPNSISSRKEKGKISNETFDLLLKQLKKIDFSGRISYHFYNEPLLNKNIVSFVRKTKEKLKKSSPVIYTNGDFLSKDLYIELISAGVCKFIITDHEQPKKINHYGQFTNYPHHHEYIINLSFKDLMITNRGGVMPTLITREDVKASCYAPSNLVIVTLKGNVLPCYEDYDQKEIMGNIHCKNIIDIWNSEKSKVFRKNCEQGARNLNGICSKCNNRSHPTLVSYEYLL